MPMSIRFDPELEKTLNQASKKLNMTKSEIIKRSVRKFLSELQDSYKISPYDIYKRLENEIPGSGHGSLSVEHSAEVLKYLQSKKK